MNLETQIHLIQRLKLEKDKGLLQTIYTADGTRYTPDDIVKEAERGSPIGMEFLEAEKKLMDFLKSKM